LRQQLKKESQVRGWVGFKEEKGVSGLETEAKVWLTEKRVRVK